MFGIDDALLLKGGQAALKYGPALAGALFGGGKNKTDWGSIANFSNSLRPEGYITPADLEAADQTKARLKRGVAATAGTQRAQAQIRATQRGTGVSPALETTLARINQNEATGQANANATGEEQIYNTRLGRERFGQQKALSILGGRLGEASYGRYANAARQSTWINSLLDLSRSSLDALGKTTKDPVDQGENSGVPSDDGGDGGYG